MKPFESRRKVPKWKLFLQQLKNHGLLNNLFMVEAGVNDKNEIHKDTGAITIASTSGCIGKVDVKQEMIIKKMR
jgi:hypothetical protein